MSGPESSTFRHARRRHIADDVLDQLAEAILRGELKPGSALAPERVLVERFDVSRMIVRQAVHRLAELGLVRVKHGGATIVLDPEDATDLRVLALFYRFAPSAGRKALAVADMVEKQYMQGLSMVEVASRRAGPEDLAKVMAVVEQAEASSEAELSDFGAFEERFWRAFAASTHNRIFRMEVAWWYEALTVRPVPPEAASKAPRERLPFYRELVERLLARNDPVEYYLAATRPILDAVIARTVPQARQHGSKATE
jgi:DNA-binding FadR family transcriptional regulator